MEKFEIDALAYASRMAGEYIEFLGKTDMAAYTKQEWDQLIECIGISFCQKRAELNTEIPF